MRTSFIIIFIITFHFTSWACELERSKSTLANLTWVTEDYPPYNYIDSKGEIRGIFTDILLLIYQELDLEISVKDITVIPWARLYHQLSFEEGVAAFSMTNTIERAKRFKLIALPYKGKISILVKKERATEIAKKTPEDIVIAVVREDIGHHLLNHYEIPSLQVHTTSSHGMLKMLLHDRVDAIAYAEDVAYFQFEKLGIGADLIVPLQVLENEKVNSYIFHRNTDKCVTALFEKTITQLHQQGKLNDVFSLYLKDYFK